MMSKSVIGRGLVHGLSEAHHANVVSPHSVLTKYSAIFDAIDKLYIANKSMNNSQHKIQYSRYVIKYDTVIGY